MQGQDRSVRKSEEKIDHFASVLLWECAIDSDSGGGSFSLS